MAKKKEELTKIQKQARSVPRTMLTEWKRDLWMKSHEEARFKAQLASGIPTIDAIFNMAYSKGHTDLAKTIATYTSPEAIKSRELALQEKRRESDKLRRQATKSDNKNTTPDGQPKVAKKVAGGVTSQKIEKLETNPSTKTPVKKGRKPIDRNNSIYPVRKGGFVAHGPKNKHIESKIKSIDGKRLYGKERSIANDMTRKGSSDDDIIARLRKERAERAKIAKEKLEASNKAMIEARSKKREKKREKKKKAKADKAKKELDELNAEAKRMGFKSHAEYLKDVKEAKALRSQDIQNEKRELQARKLQYAMSDIQRDVEYQGLKKDKKVFIQKSDKSFQRLMQSIRAIDNLKGKRIVTVVLKSNGKELGEDPAYYGNIHEKGKGKGSGDFTFIKPALEKFEKDIVNDDSISKAVSVAFASREKKPTVTQVYNEMAHTTGEKAVAKVRVYIEKEKDQVTQDWKFPKNRNLIETRELLDSISYVVTTKTGRIRER